LDGEICDVVIVVDPRFAGGTAHSVAREIAALAGAGWSVRYLSTADAGEEPLPQALASLRDQGVLRAVGPGGARCRLLIAHQPLAFEEPLAEGPAISTSFRILVAHQAALDGTGDRLVYDPVRVEHVLEERFGGRFLWAAISESCRENLLACGCGLAVLETLWLTALDLDQWAGPRPEGPLLPVPTVGRHSRADRFKFPTDLIDLRVMFPASDDLRVRMMGVPDDVVEAMAPLPTNWTILPQGAEPVADFLRSIDFFAYFHHDELFETYGLTIVEAMASGVIVLLPEKFRTNFGDVPVYCAPGGVPEAVRALFKDRAAFAHRSQAGFAWVRERHAPEHVATRIERVVEAQAAGRLPVLNGENTAIGAARRRRHARRRALRRIARIFRALPFGEPLIRAAKSRFRP